MNSNVQIQYFDIDIDVDDNRYRTYHNILIQYVIDMYRYVP